MSAARPGSPGRADAAPVARLSAVCASVGPRLPEPAASAVAAVAARLAEPQLRIAVGGRLNAGKSTLVNALLGQCLAATAATECTRLVTWFRPGPQNRVQVRLKDGSAHHVPAAPGGGVPDGAAALGASPDDITELVVEAPNDALERSYRLVDTPGMDALSGLDEVALAALGRADALLYVMPHPGEGDQEALEALRRQAGQGVTAVGALGVLSRIDELGRGDDDPWPQAHRLSATYARRLTGLVADVVPVAGLLAQAACCERYTDADTVSVGRLAKLPPHVLDEALYSAGTFADWPDGPLHRCERMRLLSLLGRYGIREAVRSYDGHSTRALLDRLRASSGFDTLRDRLRLEFTDRADRLRAATAFRALSEVAGRLPADGRAVAAVGELRSELSRVGRHPVLRQAALSTAMADLATGSLVLGEERAAALTALARGGSAAGCLGLHALAPAEETAARARSEAGRWRMLEQAPQRSVRGHARAARELCEALYFSLGTPGPSDAPVPGQP